jgi:hypothetical protein
MAIKNVTSWQSKQAENKKPPEKKRGLGQFVCSKLIIF